MQIRDRVFLVTGAASGLGAAVARMVASWPARVRADRAARLGLTPDPDFDSIIRMHLAESRPGGDSGR